MEGPEVCQEMFVFLIVSAFVCGSELSVLNHRQFWDCIAVLFSSANSPNTPVDNVFKGKETGQDATEI